MSDRFNQKYLPDQDVRWESLIVPLGEANRALAHYGGVLGVLPNPGILLSPLTTQEAVLSSRIEGTQATLSEVLRFEAGDHIDKETTKEDIREIINYRLAIRKAHSVLGKKPFHLNLLLELHAILLDSVRGRTKGRGRFRTVQNWIGSPGSPIEKAEYVPPPPEEVKNLMSRWERMYHEETYDPLVRLALVHAQFEVIHPFLDGNGRLGRILIPLFLFERKILYLPIFYLSRYLENHRDKYIEALRSIGQPGSVEGWIKFFLTAIAEEAGANARKVVDILEMRKRLEAKIIELTRSRYAAPLADFIFRFPVFQTTQLVISKSMPSKPMVMSMVGRLKDAGILKVLRKPAGSKAQILAYAELVNLCEGKKVI